MRRLGHRKPYFNLDVSAKNILKDVLTRNNISRQTKYVYAQFGSLFLPVMVFTPQNVTLTQNI